MQSPVKARNLPSSGDVYLMPLVPTPILYKIFTFGVCGMFTTAILGASSQLSCINLWLGLKENQRVQSPVYVGLLAGVFLFPYLLLTLGLGVLW